MLAIIFYPLFLAALWLAWSIYTYISNVLILRKLGFPIVHLPLIAQNSPLWMVFGPVSRPWLKSRLPAYIFNRISLAIYGLEFTQKDVTFKEIIEPKARADPKLLGNGRTYTIATSGRPELWTCDPEFAKEIYSRSKDFVQFEIGSFVMGTFGDNVITTDGSEWARHRRIVAGAVTERVSSVVWNESIRQTRDLLAAITKSGASGGKACSGTSYQMFDLIKRAAIHVLFAAGMGQTQEFSAPSASEPSEKLPPGVRLSYFDAVRIINENTGGPVIFPTSILRNWPSFLPGARWFHEIAQAKTDFPAHTRNNLLHERELASASSQPRNNVMSALLAASDRNEDDPEKAGSTPARKGPALSEDELIGNLYIFTAAGFDTTANSLAFALILLARYPKWQAWLIEELDSILPQPPSDSTESPTYSYQTIFPRSQRALAVMFETLRLYPPLIHLMKQTNTTQHVTFSSQDNTTIAIPPKTTVAVNFVALHTLPSIWRNLNMTSLERKAAADDEDNIVTDEHIFRPSRWINPDGTLYKPQPGTYLPWSAGPRACPGQKMAQVEFVGILSTLFSRHRLEAVRGVKKVKGGDEVAEIPESDHALGERLDALMRNSIPKLTLEMDLFNIKEDGPGGRGLGLSWIVRR